MKKLLIAAVLVLPALAFSTPSENAGTPSLEINFHLVKDLDNIQDYANYTKGRSGDSGFRSIDFEARSYDNSILIDKTYKKNIKNEIKKPGVIMGETCRIWKNCLKDAYRDTDGYNRIYKKAVSATPELSYKSKTRGNYRGRYNQLNGDRNGRYKITVWND